MKKKLLALLLAAAMTAAISGCGSSSSSSSGSASTPSPTPSTPSAPSQGGSTATAPDKDIVIGFNADISTLDPHNGSDTLSISVRRTMYESLLTFDENQVIQPLLAESYEISEDALTYTFKLRQGIKFHDGTDFNAEAFKVNYDRCQADTTLRSNRTTSKWESVEAIDEYTVAIKLPTPNNTLLNKLTQFEVVSPKAIAEMGKDGLARATCGTGAYTLKERLEGDHVTVVPNPDYWNGAPTVDSVTFRAIPEDGSRVAMLQTGEADFIYPMPSIQAPTLIGTQDIQVLAVPSAIMRYVTLNKMVTELSDVRVRQAMNYAINKEAYVKTVFNGFGDPVASIYPSTIQYYSAQPDTYAFDLEKSKQLMKDAGFENGFELTIWGDNATTEQKGMQFIQQQLAQIGIKVEVLPMEPNTLNDMIYVEKDQAKINMWYVNWSASSFDADGAIRNILHKDYVPPKSANTAYYDNEEFGALLDEALIITDPAKLSETYAKAQQIAWNDAPWLFLGSDQIIAAQKSYVNGIHIGPDGALNVNKVTVA